MSEPVTSSIAEPLVTKHGVTVAVGQEWRDCDKRMHGRKRIVVELDLVKKKVRMGVTRDDQRGTWISVRRMHKHSTGWELVA